MKLDSVVYDVDNLTYSLTEQLQLDSPTFRAMYPSETATSMINVMAGYGSMLQYMVVSAIANCYTDSAFSPSGIYQLAETLGNKLHGNVAAKLTCQLTRTTCRGVRSIIPANSLFEVEGVQFFNPSPISFASAVNTVKDVLLVQGVVNTLEYNSSGVADEKIYFGNDFKVDTNYVKVFVNNEEWGITDSFISYDLNSVVDSGDVKVVLVATSSDGRSYVQLGNGINGLLPTAGSLIKIQYVNNSGEEGNILKNDLTVVLKSPIYYNNVLLEVQADTSSTAYGGAPVQSLATLKYSSPYVFASGNRCVRRNDYKAMLLNKCGYLTCNVWGEYETAKMKGTYDKIMMNMVYYTGLKAYQKYDYEFIGKLDSFSNWRGSLVTTRAFPGSVSVKISDPEDPTNYVIYEDNGGKGLLFNNNDQQFDVDDLLDDYANDRLSIQVVDGGTTGLNTISNIIYNLPNSYINTYYESAAVPSSYKPIQIAFNYIAQNVSRAIAGIKFYIPNGDSTYLKNTIGSFALFGTNEINPDYNNVKNNSDWAEVIPFTNLTPGEIGGWSNWVASTLYSGSEGASITSAAGITYYRDSAKDNILYYSYGWTTADKKITVYTGSLIPKPADPTTGFPGDSIYTREELSVPFTTVAQYITWTPFTHYVLEVYSLQDGSNTTLKLGKIKVLYAETEKDGEPITEISTIDYNDNGAIALSVPGGSGIFENLYRYDLHIENVTVENGYATNDILTYDFDTGLYEYDTPVISDAGQNYIVGDIVTLDLTDGRLKYKVTDVDSDGRVLEGILLKDQDNVEYNGVSNTTLLSRPIAYLKVTAQPSGAKIQLDSKNFIVSEEKVKYFRYLEGDDGNAVAWATAVSPTTVVYTDSQTPSTSMNIYDSADLINVISHVTDFTLPLPEPRDLKVTIESVKIYQSITATLLAVLPVPDSEHNVDFSYRLAVEGNTNLAGKYNFGEFTKKFTSTTSKVGHDGLISVKTYTALEVQASYCGNRISEEEISSIDEVIIEEYNHFTTYIEYKQPEIVQTRINARVKYNNSVNVTEVKQKIINAVNDLFEITPDYMGKMLKLSDVYNAIRDVNGVEYCIVEYPTSNVVINPYELIVLSELELTDEV